MKGYREEGTGTERKTKAEGEGPRETRRKHRRSYWHDEMLKGFGITLSPQMSGLVQPNHRW